VSAFQRQTERITKLRQERRAKLYVIDKEVLFGIFESGIGNPEFTYGVDGVPKDCIVDNVGWDFNYNGIVYRVLHESFAPVQEGTIPIYESLNVTVKKLTPTKVKP
jgi:hypothetical protein